MGEVNETPDGGSPNVHPTRFRRKLEEHLSSSQCFRWSRDSGRSRGARWPNTPHMVTRGELHHHRATTRDGLEKLGADVRWQPATDARKLSYVDKLALRFLGGA